MARFNLSPSIFVNVASFCDPHLNFTIKWLLENSANPSRLHIGIVNQGSEIFIEDSKSAKITVIDIKPEHSGGACWARHLAMSLYAGEDFYFQIDSHTFLEKDWDVKLIELVAKLYERSRKPIISTRPLGFQLDGDNRIILNKFSENTVRLVPRNRLLSEENPVLMFDAHAGKSTETLVGYQLSAAFIFCSGRFVRELPYDPMLYFHGEEQNMSIRALSQGWDIYHPCLPPLYHMYKQRADGEAKLHWDNEFETNRLLKAQDRTRNANKILWRQLNGLIDGPYGNGVERSVSYYLDNLGVTLEKAAKKS